MAEQIERIKTYDVPCGNPVARIICMICGGGKGGSCELYNDIMSYKLPSFCPESDKGRKCGECTGLEFEMDACRHTGFIATVYRWKNDIKEDDRHFKQRPPLISMVMK